MLFRLQRFPKKICSHRLVENVPVAERAMDIWPNIEKFVEAAKLGNIKLPKNKLFKVVADSVVYSLFLVRFHVFLSVAKLVTPFLTVYQTDLPMVPLLCSDLKGLLSDIMARFIKASRLKDATTAVKLLCVEVAN